jgi:hypothetical protein
VWHVLEANSFTITGFEEGSTALPIITPESGSDRPTSEICGPHMLFTYPIIWAQSRVKIQLGQFVCDYHVAHSKISKPGNMASNITISFLVLL